MNLDKLQDRNHIPFIERENKYNFMSLGIEPAFTSKYEEDLDFDALPAAKRRTTRISTNIGKIKKMNAIRTNMFLDKEYDDIKVSKGAPKGSKTIKALGLAKLGTNKNPNLGTKNYSKQISSGYEMTVEKKYKGKRMPMDNDEYLSSSRRGMQITIDSFKLKTRNDSQDKTGSTKRSILSKDYSQSSKSISKSKREKHFNSQNVSARDLLEKRKMINQKYTFKNVRSGSRKKVENISQKKVKENKKITEARSSYSFEGIKIYSNSIKKSPNGMCLKVKKKNKKNFSSIVESPGKNNSLHPEEEKSQKSSRFSIRTPRTTKKSKKPPKSAYLKSLLNKEIEHGDKFTQLIREQSHEHLPKNITKIEFGSAKKFKKENRGNRSKKKTQK